MLISFTKKNCKPFVIPLLLLVVAVMAYGLLINSLGFAWDDLVAVWIRYQLGPEAMQRCFTVSRPILGWLFQLTTLVIPEQPAAWHIFAILCRWVGAVLLWKLMMELIPAGRFLSAASALLFLVYPGFSQQFVSYTYSHYFLVLACFLLSLLLNIFAIRSPQKFWLYTIPACLLSLINLLALEYFFTLELFRIAVIWLALRRDHPEGISVRYLLLNASPYLIIFLVVILGKLFLFPNQLYQIIDLGVLLSSRDHSVPSLFSAIGLSLWFAGIAAWGMIFNFPAPGNEGLLLSFWVVCLVAAGLIFPLLYWTVKGKQEQKPFREHFVFFIIALYAILLAGWPFWLIDFPFSLQFPSDRFTLPFMLGISLLLAGFLDAIPVQKLRVALLTGFVCLAVGRQYVLAHEYVREWELQKNLFWQLSWRIPGMEKGTLVFLNDGALDYYADNSLVAPLNWLYAPDNRSVFLDYLLFHPRSRLGGSLPSLAPDVIVSYDRYAFQFTGSTSRSLALDYTPPGCLRVLDPVLDPYNIAVQSPMQEAARLSDEDLILTDGLIVFPGLYGSEPPHDWCYYYSKAELAHQSGDWDTVLNLYHQASSLGMYPADPDEWLIIIESYAHAGQWNIAGQITTDLSLYVPQMDPMLCRLWQRILENTTATPERTSVIQVLAERMAWFP